MSELPANNPQAEDAQSAPSSTDVDGSAANRPLPADEPRPRPLPPPESQEIVDVWSRTEPKYRRRAVILLAINFLLFCGLCLFTHWLHVGDRVFDVSWQSYWRPARFWDPGAPNLNDFILRPINVVDVPLHAVVLGLLVAVMVAVPIVVAMLYRMAFAIPFILAVFVFAHMPWMAATLAGSCVLAAVRPFRLKFRFGAALVGLLPVLVYLLLATRGLPDQFANYGSPTQQSLLMAPWILAILAASLICGLVLAIARLVNHRPGAVAPVLAIMFAVPVTLFHVGVGTDELVYRVLEEEYGPRSKRFQAVAPPAETRTEILGLFSSALESAAFGGPILDDLRGVWSGETDTFTSLRDRACNWFMARFLADRAEAYEQCKRFIADFPNSRYVKNVLYIQARVMDTRLDVPRLRNDWRRELYTEFPHAQSEEIWLKLVKQFPDSPLATVGRLRIAELALRNGRVNEALTYARDAVTGNAGAMATQPAQRGLLDAVAAEISLDFSADPYRIEARRLLALIEDNRDDPQFGNQPLRGLACIDPRRERYDEQLLRLAEQFRGSSLEDNIVLRWAVRVPDAAERAETLAACIRTYPNGDATPQARFRLATHELQGPGSDSPQQRERGLRRLRELADAAPDSYWGRQAAERLALLRPSAEGMTAP